MIKVTNLCAEYPGKRVLHHLNFEVKANTITALVGPNGAGKTTLLKLLAGLETPFEGAIQINDIDIEKNPRSIHQTLGFLPDFFGLYQNLTVKQCLEFSALSHYIPESELKNAADYVVSLLELESYLDKKTQTLSRGYRQRLAIAQTVIFKPKLLLLDEPASGLDPESRIQLSKLILKLKDNGLTILVSSHILSELEDYCSEMLILRDGRLIHHRDGGANEDDKQRQEPATQTLKIDFVANPTHSLEFFKAILANTNGVMGISLNGSSLDVSYTGSEQIQSEITQLLFKNNVGILQITKAQDSLQDIYLKYQDKQDKA